MKTKWGGCSPERETIRLNTELAKKPPGCLEYLVVHGMIHFLEPTHNERFASLMDRFMSNWRSRKNFDGDWLADGPPVLPVGGGVGREKVSLAFKFQADREVELEGRAGADRGFAAGFVSAEEAQSPLFGSRWGGSGG